MPTKKSPVMFLIGRWIEKILQPKVALLIWDPGVELERPLGLVVGQVWCNHWGWIEPGPSSPERSNAICNLSWSMCEECGSVSVWEKTESTQKSFKTPLGSKFTAKHLIVWRIHQTPERHNKCRIYFKFICMPFVLNKCQHLKITGGTCWKFHQIWKKMPNLTLNRSNLKCFWFKSRYKKNGLWREEPQS